jgi:UPF0755 protein
MIRIGILIAVALIIAGAFEWEAADFVAPGPKATQSVVLISPKIGVAGISDTLESAGLVKNGLIFRIGVMLRRESGALKAGEYAIPASASMKDIAAILMSGKSIQHRLTAAEGLTSNMIFTIVESDATLEGAAYAPVEGTLLPETYLFTRGMTRAQMLGRMHTAQQKFIDAHWSTRVPGLPLQNADQAIVLASIVEKETAIPEERRHIAAVFLNRLKLGMKLQSDPTIIYGLTKGYPLGRPIRESEIQAATPYNTYAITGLPAAPICNPGKDAIAAVLNPEPSADLYFVANGTGGHVFAATVQEHLKNVAKWRQIEHQPEKLSPHLRQG